MKNKSQDVNCTCDYCHATYYSLNLFSRALTEAKTEDDRVHMIYNPIARIAIPRSNLLTKDLIDDARAIAIGNMFVYSKQHKLCPSENCFYALIRCAKNARGTVLRLFIKHECAWTKPEYDDIIPCSTKHSRLIGKRVYPKESAEFEYDAFNRLIDKHIVYDAYNEDDCITRLDAKDTLALIFNSTNLKLIYQTVADLGLTYNIYSQFEDQSTISTEEFLTEMQAEVFPVTIEVGIERQTIETFFCRAREVLGSEVNMKKLLRKAYNRHKGNAPFTV